jgi:MFS family permease
MGTVLDHFRTLWNPDVRKPLLPEIFGQIVLPIAVGILALFFNWRAADISGVVGGASVLSGFLFSVAVFVFQLRQGVTDDPRIQQRRRLPDLIDQLFANVLWAVIVSFALTAVVLVVTSAPPPTDKHGHPEALSSWLTAALLVLGIHLFAVVWMCVRRLRAAYREMRS